MTNKSRIQIMFRLNRNKTVSKESCTIKKHSKQRDVYIRKGKKLENLFICRRAYSILTAETSMFSGKICLFIRTFEVSAIDIPRIILRSPGKFNTRFYRKISDPKM